MAIKHIKIDDTEGDFPSTAKEIGYTKNNGTNTTVEQALNELYENNGANTANVVMYVLGDSTATDKNRTYYNNASIYRVLARLLGCRENKFHNYAVAGAKIINNLVNNYSKIQSDATHIFIQGGYNDAMYYNEPGAKPVGDINNILSITDPTDANLATSTLGVYYKYILLLLLNTTAKIYCISPFITNFSGDKLTYYNTFRQGIKKIVETLAVGENYNRLFHIDGYVVAWHSIAEAVNFTYSPGGGQDGIHPSTQGAVYIANNIYNFIKGLDRSSINDVPSLVVSKNTIILNAAVGETVSDTVHLSIRRCGNVSLSMYSNNNVISIDPPTINAANDDIEKDVEIIFTPTVSMPLTEVNLKIMKNNAYGGKTDIADGMVVVKISAND